MFKHLLSFGLLLFSFSFISAQTTWKGKVVDTKGDALPFVNVFFEGTSVGTTTNMSGEFSLNQPTGKNILLFQFVGFERKKLDLNQQESGKNLQITLKEQALEIKEVTVAAYKKDPAYYVIKQAQKKRKFHLNQVESYTCKIYMKGTTRLVAKPDKLPGIFSITTNGDDKKAFDSLKTGLMYLSESIARVNYEKGTGFKEEMLASKVSGDGQAFSWNKAREVLVSFYEDRQHFGGLNERGFVSPIAPDAMLYYDYKLLGTFKEDGLTINRIAVMPKRKTDPVFSGTLYIVEDLWNIHSLNLKVNKEAQVEFIDSININQSFARIENELFMPLSLQMTYHFGLFGFRANYDAIGNITEYEIGKFDPEKFAKNQVFKVDKSANKQDSSFWNTQRPIVLSGEEKENIVKGDSLKAVYTSKNYLDSMDRIDNKVRPFGLITGGYSNFNRYDSLTHSVNGILSGLQYTSVDGVVLELKPTRTRETTTGNIKTELGLRYGFSSEKFGFKIKRSQLHNQFNRFTDFVEAGWFTQQINEQEPISPLVNSLYTLIDGKNYAQFYNKAYLKFGMSGELINGLNLGADIELASRSNLQNTTSYNFNNRELINPENKAVLSYPNPGLIQHDGRAASAKFNLTARIAFGQKFAIYPDKKVNYRSKYPKLRLHYQLGFSGGPSTALWHFAEAEVYDNVKMGSIGDGEYSVKAGNFFGQKPTNFIDYKHFMGNQTLFLHNQTGAFQNLPYYSYSTNGAFLEAHYEHHFYGFLLNKIPLVKKLKWKEVAGVNFLYSQNNKDYTEVFAGIDNLFRFFKVHFVSYYQNGQPLKPALRIGVRIN